MRFKDCEFWSDRRKFICNKIKKFEGKNIWYKNYPYCISEAIISELKTESIYCNNTYQYNIDTNFNPLNIYVITNFSRYNYSSQGCVVFRNVLIKLLDYRIIVYTKDNSEPWMLDGDEILNKDITAVCETRHDDLLFRKKNKHRGDIKILTSVIKQIAPPNE